MGLVGAGRSGGAGAATLTPYLIRITAGAAWQAALSTVISLLAGTLMALALARRVPAGRRGLVLALLAIVTAAPALVIVFGLVAAHGRSGWLPRSGMASDCPLLRSTGSAASCWRMSR